jgi:hypothetical protein
MNGWFGTALPKSERLKLAARRLSNIAQLGEAGVRRLERKLENNASGRGVANDDHSASATSLDYHPGSSSLDYHNPGEPMTESGETASPAAASD